MSEARCPHGSAVAGGTGRAECDSTTLCEHTACQVGSIELKGLETVVHGAHHVGVRNGLTNIRRAAVVKDESALLRGNLLSLVTDLVGAVFGLIWVLVKHNFLVALEEV